MERRLGRLIALLVACAAVLTLAHPATAEDEPNTPLPEAPPAGALPTIPYADVPSSYWAAGAIKYVGFWRAWMPFYDGTFSPRAAMTRRIMARAVVRAFAPEDVRVPAIVFSDLPASNSWEPYANIAVKRGWMFAKNGVFDPNGGVTKREMDRTLVRALGLIDEANGLQAIKTTTGHTFKKPAAFAYLVIAEELHLNYNYPVGSESLDLYPWDVVPREYFAHALMKAAEHDDWASWRVQHFREVVLPAMDWKRRQLVEFALQYVGYPYVYAHEWYRSGFGMPQGGFDCSGFQWWVTQRHSTSYPVGKVRPYAGWRIGQRRASLIAREAATEDRIWGLNLLKAGDLVGFDADGNDSNWRNIDHGGVSLGGRWFIHSSGSRGGVTIGTMADGSWWRDAFVVGRRLFD